MLLLKERNGVENTEKMSWEIEQTIYVLVKGARISKFFYFQKIFHRKKKVKEFTLSFIILNDTFKIYIDLILSEN